MKIKKLFIIILLSLFLLSSSPIGSINIENNFFEINKDNTIFVDDDNILGPWDGTIEHPYWKIQDAINYSINKDKIYVFNGTYYENIIVNKSIKIFGEKNCIIDGSYKEFVINIIKNNVNLENLIIKNSDGFNRNCGIKINTNNNIIKNCMIYRTKDAIYINKSFNNLILNSFFHTNGAGIVIDSSYENTIKNCYFEHNSIAIHADNSYKNIIKTSNFNSNGISYYNTDSQYNIVQQCNISNNVDNHGGIFLDNSSNIIINKTIIIHNGIGIHIDDSKNVNINDCRLYLNTHYAIIIRKNSENITISECEIINNFRFGIYILENCKINITKNNIYNNTLYGLYSKNSICNLSNNWWGSKYGPSIFEFGKGDRIYPIININMKSWLKAPINFEKLTLNYENIFVYNNSEYNLKIIDYITGLDTDNDGATDYWEEKWGYNPNEWNDHQNLDPDKDYLNNLEECYTDKYNSNPFKKDIFLEIDWMESYDEYKSNKPMMFLFNRAIENFNEHNITLHIDIGELDGGEEIPFCNLTFSFARLRDIYWNYFLHNDLNNPRKGIFHYGIICNYCPDLSFPFMGWDQYDSYAISVEWTKSQSPVYSRQSIITGGSLHQLGSTLGLLVETHGGNDNLGTIKPFSIQWLKYLNYKSCMNYNYKYEIFTYSDGSHGPGDFNDWNQLNLSFFKNSNFMYNYNK